MRETRADNALALTWALVLHALLALLVVFGLHWARTPVSAAGEPVVADLVDPSALSPAARRALAAEPREVPAPEPEPATPPPQPQPEPRPEESPVPPQPQPQEAVPEPDVVEQERVVRDAADLAATAQREQEAKRRQEQVDLTERQRQQEAERRQRLSEMERQRLEQLVDIRRQRAQAAREAELAEQKLRQLAEARARSASESASQSAASPPPGSRGDDASLQAQYAQALADAIRRNWVRPDSVPEAAVCKLRIRQIPGGEVIDVEVAPSCPYDEIGRRSVEAAVLKAQPLPYAGFERVFSRDLTLNFRARD